MINPEDILISGSLPDKVPSQNEAQASNAAESAEAGVDTASFRSRYEALQSSHESLADMHEIRKTVNGGEQGVKSKMSVGERIGLFFTFDKKEKAQKINNLAHQQTEKRIQTVINDHGRKILADKQNNENANKELASFQAMFQGMSEEDRKMMPDDEYNSMVSKLNGERIDREKNIASKQRDIDGEINLILSTAQAEQMKISTVLSDFENTHRELHSEISMVRGELNKRKSLYDRVLAAHGKGREEEIAHLTVSREYKELQEKMDELTCVEADLRKRKDIVTKQKSDIDCFVGRLSGIGMTAGELSARQHEKVNGAAAGARQEERIARPPAFASADAADDYEAGDETAEDGVEGAENVLKDTKGWVKEIVDKDMLLQGLKVRQRNRFALIMREEARRLGKDKEMKIDDVKLVLNSLLKHGALDEVFEGLGKFKAFKNSDGSRKRYLNKLVEAIRTDSKIRI